ncbi:MAG: hypothetical protein NTZ61_20455 [Proteobacteria bacterium]|nr:hypothetical protein [Pseudomonadota bacterium]
MKCFKPLAGVALFGTLVIVNGAFAETVTTETTTSSSGTFFELTPGSIVIKSATMPEPLPYSFTKTTTYVDENGNAVAMETVKSGEPMTVYYTKTGDARVASKVVIKRSVTKDATGATIEEKKTTVTTP